MVYCSNCNKSIDLRNKTIDTLITYIQGEKVILTYVECDTCDSKLYVQIDNDETKQILEQLVKVIDRSKQDKQNMDKLRKQYKRLNLKLSNLRKELREQYEGRKVWNNVILNTEPLTFSIK